MVHMLPLLAGLFVVAADVASSLGCAVLDEVAVWELGQQRPGYKDLTLDSSKNKPSKGNRHTNPTLINIMGCVVSVVSNRVTLTQAFNNRELHLFHIFYFKDIVDVGLSRLRGVNIRRDDHTSGIQYLIFFFTVFSVTHLSHGGRLHLINMHFMQRQR